MLACSFWAEYCVAMSYRELPPESGLTPAEWQVRIAQYEGPRSPMATYIEIGKIARRHNLPEAVAALHYAEDMQTLADPRLQESMRQLEVGELVEITPNI